ncbi:hypothetical protein B484DRAFT_428891 [Ochromonadaceae sp. CCMP2298]|nr:hypothetical protein B484DRAFT_428891 [Ochromonadaceae sp. CCMP2298]
MPVGGTSWGSEQLPDEGAEEVVAGHAFGLSQNAVRALGPLGTLLAFLWSIGTCLLDFSTHGEYTSYEYMHEKQTRTWDCGLACANMIILWSNGPNLVGESKLRGGPARPITGVKSRRPLWTIELFCLLCERLPLPAPSPDSTSSAPASASASASAPAPVNSSLGAGMGAGAAVGMEVECTYYTRFAGVNPEHQAIEWYASALSPAHPSYPSTHDSACSEAECRTKSDSTDSNSDSNCHSSGNSDELRAVRDGFALARRRGWAVREEEVGLEWLKEAVRGEDSAAVLLVDVLALDDTVPLAEENGDRRGNDEQGCEEGEKGQGGEDGGMGVGVADSTEDLHTQSPPPPYPYSAFSGHYLVLVDYIPSRDAFVCLNPSSRFGETRVQARRIERARRHPGTDLDLILCRRIAATTAPAPATGPSS